MIKDALALDEDFLAYMEGHSQTPRALFSRKQVNRLLTMAGEEPDEWREWVAWHYWDMKPTLEAAKKNAGYGGGDKL